mmetsp:Transcript_35764/g.114998  ORF Transcript_35764/g.114998 Transcript_35764/m.114998 type:complete len:491 (+) Transcript_35764:250-1722(+)
MPLGVAARQQRPLGAASSPSRAEEGPHGGCDATLGVAVVARCAHERLERHLGFEAHSDELRVLVEEAAAARAVLHRAARRRRRLGAVSVLELLDGGVPRGEAGEANRRGDAIGAAAAVDREQPADVLMGDAAPLEPRAVDGAADADAVANGELPRRHALEFVELGPPSGAAPREVDHDAVRVVGGGQRADALVSDAAPAVARRGHAAAHTHAVADGQRPHAALLSLLLALALAAVLRRLLFVALLVARLRRFHHQRGARRLPQRRPRTHAPAEGERRRPTPQLARRAALCRAPAWHARRAAPPRPYADGAGLRRHLRGGVVAAPAAARRGGMAAHGPVPRDAPPQVQPDAHARGDEAGACRRLQEHTRQRRRRQGEREREGGRGQGLPGDAGRAARPALVRPARPRRQPLGDHADDPSRERAVHPLQEVPGLAEAEPGLRDAGARQVRTDHGKDHAQGGHDVMARGLPGALEPHMQAYRRLEPAAYSYTY